MLIIDQAQARALLPMNDCVPLMQRTLSTLAAGNAVQPLRTLMRLPNGNGILGVMPAYVGDPAALGVKLITVFHGNHGSNLDSHQGAVLHFSPDTGELLAVIDASSITAIRTAAVSAVATRVLARADAKTLCIIGSGVQGYAHLDAMRQVRDLSTVRVWSRSHANAQKFASNAAERFGLPVHAHDSVERATRDADIICTVTSSREPVLQSQWIADGTHLNVVGASVRTSREADSATLARSRLYVDRRESTQNESGDFLIPLGEGIIDESHIVAEIGEVLLGTKGGRRNDTEVTMFKSLGLAVEDVAAAEFIYRAATTRGVGTQVHLGGVREA